MTALAVTAITNFILACEVFFLSGLLAGRPMTRGSAAWFWTAALLALGTSALLGGIDHGFIEPAGLQGQVPLYRLTWLVLGVMILSVWLTTARQFFAPRRFVLLLVIGLVQLALLAVLIVVVGQFWVVIVSYLPVILLFLLMNILGLRRGRGSWALIAGILIMLLASLVQYSGFDTLSPLDHNGLYHVMAMVGVVFLYWGGHDALNRDVLGRR
jgi:hypothetical protein